MLKKKLSLEVNDSLQKLEELTKKLDFSKLVKNSHDGCFEIKAEHGKIECCNIFEDEKISIVRCFISANTIMPLHVHEKSAEHMLIYDGEMHVFFEDGKEIIVKKGEQIKIDVGVPHLVRWAEDTLSITSTFPPQKEFSGEKS